jgi:hypothetical protein
MPQPKLSRFDYKLLGKIAAHGWWFDDDRSLRPYNLEQLGLLRSDLRLKRQSNSGAEYKKAYSLTEAGEKAVRGAP